MKLPSRPPGPALFFLLAVASSAPIWYGTWQHFRIRTEALAVLDDYEEMSDTLGHLKSVLDTLDEVILGRAVMSGKLAVLEARQENALPEGDFITACVLDVGYSYVVPEPPCGETETTVVFRRADNGIYEDRPLFIIVP